MKKYDIISNFLFGTYINYINYNTICKTPSLYTSIFSCSVFYLNINYIDSNILHIIGVNWPLMIPYLLTANNFIFIEPNKYKLNKLNINY